MQGFSGDENYGERIVVTPVSAKGIPTMKPLELKLDVENIAGDPTRIGLPLNGREPQTIKVFLEAKEVIAEVSGGIQFNYWTFNSQVPGPFLRAREGDIIELTLKNHESSHMPHSIDLHAVNGPGGGSLVSQVNPGEEKTFSFKALNPGLYVYHCATPNVATHMTKGMYGLILVEPAEGLSEVDKEFYIMQGELYTSGNQFSKGLQKFSFEKMTDENPSFVVFNGKVNSLDGQMKAKVGDKIRLFVGNGGVSLSSNFHVIGEIFDKVYVEGGSLINENVQTTLIPAGGSTIVEFTVEEPGSYLLVDHALNRVNKGAIGVLVVEGEHNDEIYSPKPGENKNTH
ncbi:nitrite reductase, copper-containing [Candidatus Micrarchaeota archaeon]|nr:nitrite reductase, copper-containing [Candidatus Micrarchaeota archaeon]